MNTNENSAWVPLNGPVEKVFSAAQLLASFEGDTRIRQVSELLKNSEKQRISLNGMLGSSASAAIAAVHKSVSGIHLVILSDKESAVYFCNDLENLLGDTDENFHRRHVLFFPTSYKKPYEPEKTDNSNVLMRTEVLKRISTRGKDTIIVTYPEALTEKVVNRKYLEKSTLKLKRGETVDLDFIYDLLDEYGFIRSDYVVEPGQFALRGGIIDVFSFTNDNPYRIEFSGDEVASLRTFDPVTQRSIDKLDHITIVPNVQDRALVESRETFLDFIPRYAILWLHDAGFASERVEGEFEKACKAFDALTGVVQHLPPTELFTDRDTFLRQLTGFNIVEFGKHTFFEHTFTADFHITPQPSFNKNFDLFLAELQRNAASGIRNVLLADSAKQVERIYTISKTLRKPIRPMSLSILCV